MSDVRAMQAREEHRLAGDAGQLAEQHRTQRNRLIRQLRAENPQRWTYPALAAAVGCSPELVAAIVKDRPVPTRSTRRRPLI
jgi:AraC-like DNA-binding protein